MDRRSDLVNAWFKKAPAEETEAQLEYLGRLMACTSQLDMYMTSNAVMRVTCSSFWTATILLRIPRKPKPNRRCRNPSATTQDLYCLLQ